MLEERKFNFKEFQFRAEFEETRTSWQCNETIVLTHLFSCFSCLLWYTI